MAIFLSVVFVVEVVQVEGIVGTLGRFSLLTWAVKYFFQFLLKIFYVFQMGHHEGTENHVHDYTWGGEGGGTCSKTGYLELGFKVNVNFPGDCSQAFEYFFRNLVWINTSYNF